uniref:uncharacterized protein n=1 Tax=Centroberyx gerrardi TaxID=166262 RepID=UPI003AAF47A7
MKVMPALAVLSVTVMVAMIFQAVRQELNLRSLKTSMTQSSAEVKRKEEAIVEMKIKIQSMKSDLTPLNTKRDELSQKKEESLKGAADASKNTETCNTEKAEAEKKKTEVAESITKLKADHEEAKKKAQEDIQTLKQQILNRDKAICAFVDQSKEEGRTLCGVSEGTN